MRRTSLLIAVSALVVGTALPTIATAAPPRTADDVQVAITAPYAKDRLIVGYRTGVASSTRAQVKAANGLGASRRISASSATTVTEVVQLPTGTTVQQAMATLRGNPAVRFVEPDYLVTHQAVSNDPYFTNGSLWGMLGDASSPANQYGSGAAEAWAAGHTGSASVYVGVIDEGIQVSHPDLASNIWVNPYDPTDGVDNDGNGYIDDTNGWDFVNNDRGVFDGAADPSIDAHGTHVSGTIGGDGGNGQGVVGVNWDVTMISGKFLGTQGGAISDAVRAVNYFTDLKARHGLNIVATSNSWGGGGYSQAMADAINLAGDRDILFIAAAGNSGTNNDTSANYPSNYQCTKGGTRGWDCVIAVASTTSTGGLSSFSQYGATTVDIGAPGSGIWSSVPNSSYASYNGTSMATPHVTGAAALCASIAPGITGAQIKAAILDSAAPTASLSGKTLTGGRLDVGAMVSRCAPATTPVSGSVTNLTATPAGETTVDLSWTDTVTDESSFEVQRATKSGGVCGTYVTAGSAGANATSYTVAGLNGTTTYCFRVRGANSYNGGSTTAWSSIAEATTATPPPPYTCAAATYSWIDTAAGTSHALADDGFTTQTLPFTFSFYGTAQTSLTISANGWVRFGGAAGADVYNNVAIPNTADPNAMIAAWWDDLNRETGGTIRTLTTGTAPNRSYVISWNGVPHFSGATTAVSFQIVLHETTNRVTLSYLDADTGATASNRGAGATVGLENAAGTGGTQIVYNSASLTSLTSYLCSNSGTLTPPSVTTSSLVGGTVGSAYSATLAASGGTTPYSWSLASGSLPAGLSLSSGGVISGTPTASGTSSFTVQVTDSSGLTGTKALSIAVAASAVAPGAFNKTAPTNGATGRSRTALVLSWGASSNATSYQYCFDTVNDNLCNTTWVTVSSTSVTISGLLSRKTYYWQVRAVNATGTTNANAGTWWRFTTVK